MVIDTDVFQTEHIRTELFNRLLVSLGYGALELGLAGLTEESHLFLLLIC